MSHKSNRERRKSRGREKREEDSFVKVRWKGERSPLLPHLIHSMEGVRIFIDICLGGVLMLYKQSSKINHKLSPQDWAILQEFDRWAKQLSPRKEDSSTLTLELSSKDSSFLPRGNTDMKLPLPGTIWHVSVTPVIAEFLLKDW